MTAVGTPPPVVETPAERRARRAALVWRWGSIAVVALVALLILILVFAAPGVLHVPTTWGSGIPWVLVFLLLLGLAIWMIFRPSLLVKILGVVLLLLILFTPLISTVVWSAHQGAAAATAAAKSAGQAVDRDTGDKYGAENDNKAGNQADNNAGAGTQAQPSGRIVITGPADGAPVPRVSYLIGKGEIPDGQVVVPLVYASGTGKYYVQDKAIPTSDGTWKARIFLGGPGPSDVGSVYKVVLVRMPVATYNNMLAARSNNDDSVDFQGTKLAERHLTRSGTD